MWTFDSENGLYDIGYVMGTGGYRSTMYTDSILVAIDICHYLNGGTDIDHTDIGTWLYAKKLKVYE